MGQYGGDPVGRRGGEPVEKSNENFEERRTEQKLWREAKRRKGGKNGTKMREGNREGIFCLIFLRIRLIVKFST